MIIDVPFSCDDKELVTRWENNLTRKGFKFKRKGGKGDVYMYKITINEPMDAFWIGCNSVAIVNKMFDSPLRITG